MRNWIVLGSIAALSACGSSGSGNDVTCGDGTTLVGDTCEAGSGSGGSGTGDTCGTGTHLDGTTCVADGDGSAGAPAIASMDPTDAGISGSALFTITGSGFAGANVSSLHVFFGDPTNANCEATVGAATSTTIAGEVPSACDFTINVNVTVTTNLGSATTPFHYDVIFAADGDGGGNFGNYAGELYAIDPFNTESGDIGTLNDGDFGYALSGLAFSGTGVLYGVTTSDSEADFLDGSSILVTVDPGTATVTYIGNTDGADETAYFVSDIKMKGTTLYGWAYDQTGGTQQLVTIDPTTAIVTVVGTPAAMTFPVGGLAVDANGNLLLAGNGAAEDTSWSDGGFAFDASGELDSVATNGTLTANANPMDYYSGSPINAMTTFEGLTIGVLDDGTYGVALGAPAFGETIALIDPSAATDGYVVTPLFSLPSFASLQPAVDALEVPPTTVAIPSRRTHTAPAVAWTPLKAVANAPTLRHVR